MDYRGGAACACASLLLVAGAFADTYQYDALGRLKQATYGNGTDVQLGYDPAGNRTSLTAGSPPVAVTDSISTNEDTAYTFDPRANDNANGGTLTITGKTDGSKGSVAILSGGTQLQYTPYSNQNGSDSFSYTINNGAYPATGTVNVTINPVNDAPVANNDSISVIYNTPYTFDPRGNDSDIDGNPLTITNKTNGSQGTVAIVSGGTQLTYTPNTGASGSDSFTYTISDGSLTSTATVSLTISVNTPPVAVNDSVSTNEDTALTFDPRTNDYDVNGQTLTITAKTDGSKGSVAIVSGGTQLTYTPYANQNGSDSFTYTISDGYATATATVSMTINAVNDAPVANNDSISVTFNTPKTFDPRGNDTDIDGPSMTISNKTNGSKGTVAIVSGGTQLTYTPNSGAYGSDSFTYTISDGTATSTATVSVNIPVIVAVNSSGTPLSPYAKGNYFEPNPYYPWMGGMYDGYYEWVASDTLTACFDEWHGFYWEWYANYDWYIDAIYNCSTTYDGHVATGNGQEIVLPQ